MGLRCVDGERERFRGRVGERYDAERVVNIGRDMVQRGGYRERYDTERVVI